MTIEQQFHRGFEVGPPSGSLAGTQTFGHGGAGGTTAFADPDRRLAFGYATTRIRLGPPGGDARAAAHVAVAYEALR